MVSPERAPRAVDHKYGTGKFISHIVSGPVLNSGRR